MRTDFDEATAEATAERLERLEEMAGDDPNQYYVGLSDKDIEAIKWLLDDWRRLTSLNAKLRRAAK